MLDSRRSTDIIESGLTTFATNRLENKILKAAGFFSCLSVLAASTVWAGDDALFREKIGPLFERHCVVCHQGEKPKGGLSLVNAKAALQGGDSGAAIEPGRPDDSLILEMISGAQPAMPKKAPPLAATEIAAVRQWIAAGAMWPADAVLRDKRLAGENDGWWSWRPLTRPATPSVKSDWVQTPVDAFVLARLQAAGLSPAPAADKRTLIRRLTYDLHGLPPTPDEIEAFLSDTGDGATGRLVERLLASPRYGERWGRHWLDVVHYGESHGYDKDKPRPNAWPYRDYVIDAFNSDKTWSRFVEEQLAGDVLFPGDPAGIVATGFIAAGPWDFVGHVELREGTLDKLIARSNDRDDMVAATMSTFMSLTVHCARCHNHKFDPIAQADYYRLQAVFAGVDRADRPYDLDCATHDTRRALQRELAALDERKKSVEHAVARVTDPAITQLDERIADTARRVAAVAARPNSGPPSPGLGYHSQIASSPDMTKWVQVDLGRAVSIDQIVLLPAHVKYGGHVGPGFGFPPRFRVDVSDDPGFSQFSIVGDETRGELANPGDAPYVVAPVGKTARYVRVTAVQLWKRTDDWIFALSELLVFSQGENVAAGAAVAALDSIEAGKSWAKANLVDGFTSLVAVPALVGVGANDHSPSNGYHSGIESRADVVKWVQVDLGQSAPIDEIRLLSARPTDFADTPGFGFPVRFRLEISNDEKFSAPTIIADHTGADFANPGDTAVVVPAGGHTGRFIRLTAERLWKRTDDFVFALAEMQVMARSTNLAAGSAVSAFDSIEGGRWSRQFLVDGFTSRGPISGLATALAGLGRRSGLQGELDRLRTAREAAVSARLDAATRTEREAVNRERDLVNQRLAALPAPGKVYAAAHRVAGDANSQAPLKPRPVYFLYRGSDKTPGPLAVPGAVAGIPGLNADFQLADPDDEGSRRAALARWVTHPGNGFMRRSIVNRVWHYHFGRGLVESPNDFGRQGAQPTHLELLDWLASEFQESGESLKSLHRLILTSAVYAQSSQPNPAASAVDSGNLLLWRMNRQRLEAEAVRDTVLYVSGDLDDRRGGPSDQQFFFKDDHSPVYDYDRFDVASPLSRRRSVYRFIVRSVPDPFMECLDAADPSLLTPKRNTTLTALQALALLNDKLIIHQAGRFAARVEGVAPNRAAQIDLAYRLALGRAPMADEAREIEAFAAEYGMANVCRLLFNCNEFLFVD